MLPRARELAVSEVLDGKYRILGTLGAGGMGNVYAARRLALGDAVAIKTLLPGLDSSETRRRFLREAQAAASIRHPNVIQILDFGGTGMPYLVMELVEGPTLGDELRTHGPLEVERGLRVFGELCAAVEAGHRRGIVHRDLKPGNVMLAQHGGVRETVKVLDFGIAKIEDAPITQDGAVLGTFQYLAPEQLRGEPASAGSDVWALGVVLYEMLTGRLPFAGKTPAATLFAIASGQHPRARDVRADIPEEIDAAIERALADDPSARPSARDLAAILGNPLPSIDAHSRPSRWSSADESGPAAPIDPLRASIAPVYGATIGHDATALFDAPLRDHPMVGRDVELRALYDAWTSAVRGEGKVALITGESGIGKTRLATELLNWARTQGGHVRRGVFFDYEGSQPRPLATFLDMLGEGEIIDDLAAPADKWRSFQRIADLFLNLRGNEPLVLLFEDLHWARALDLELIVHLHRSLSREPVLFVATARIDASHPELQKFLTQLGSARTLSLVELSPLAGDTIRGWLAAALGDVRIRPNDVRKLERATGGNPYFLEELLRHLVVLGRIRRDETSWTCASLDDLTLPATLASVVRAQIDSLGERSRDVLETAAVIGDEFFFDTLRAATELDEDTLDEVVDRAVRRGLLTEEGATSGNDYRFVSDTTRRVLYDAMSPRRRRRLHRKVVDALHVRYATSLRTLARILCYHHHAVGDFAEALSFGVQAAEDDLRAHDVDRAEASIRRARDAETALRASSGALDHLALAKLDLLEGTVAVRLGQHDRARTTLRRVLEGSKPAELRLEARLELAQMHLGTGDIEPALEEASAAIGLARTTSDFARMQYARIVHAGLLSRVGRVDAAVAELRAVIEELDDATSPALRSVAQRALAWESVKSGAFRDGESHARTALELARRARDPFAEHQALAALAAAFSEGGDSQAAVPFLRDALAISRTLSFRRREAIDLANLGESQVDLGRFDDALALFSEALAIFIEIGDRACEGDCTVNVGRALLASGRVDEAITTLERGRQLCDATGRSEYGALAQLYLGDALLARGRSDEAIAAMEHARDVFITQRLHHLWSAEWALARAKTSHPDEARSHAERAAEELRTLLAQLAPGSDAPRSRRSLQRIEQFLAGEDDDDRPTARRLS
jgi:tetratricopeptide (TPR) repeat protein